MEGLILNPLTANAKPLPSAFMQGHSRINGILCVQCALSIIALISECTDISVNILKGFKKLAFVYN